jgi:hypothetical protein
MAASAVLVGCGGGSGSATPTPTPAKPQPVPAGPMTSTKVLGWLSLKQETIAAYFFMVNSWTTGFFFRIRGPALICTIWPTAQSSTARAISPIAFCFNSLARR